MVFSATHKAALLKNKNMRLLMEHHEKHLFQYYTYDRVNTDPTLSHTTEKRKRDGKKSKTRKNALYVPGKVYIYFLIIILTLTSLFFVT